MLLGSIIYKLSVAFVVTQEKRGQGGGEVEDSLCFVGEDVELFSSQETISEEEITFPKVNSEHTVIEGNSFGNMKFSECLAFIYRKEGNTSLVPN